MLGRLQWRLPAILHLKTLESGQKNGARPVPQLANIKQMTALL
jgi:hypothetical protein